MQEPAIFYQDGKPIAYDVRMVTNADAPVLQPIPTRPGTFVYAIQKEARRGLVALRSSFRPILVAER